MGIKLILPKEILLIMKQEQSHSNNFLLDSCQNKCSVRDCALLILKHWTSLLTENSDLKDSVA